MDKARDIHNELIGKIEAELLEATFYAQSQLAERIAAQDELAATKRKLAAVEMLYSRTLALFSRREGIETLNRAHAALENDVALLKDIRDYIEHEGVGGKAAALSLRIDAALAGRKDSSETRLRAVE